MKKIFSSEDHSNQTRCVSVTPLPHGRALTFVGRLLKGFADVYAEAQQRQRAFEELTAMSDRELADMGITRADIPAIVAGTYQRPQAATSNVIPFDQRRRLQTSESRFAAASSKKSS